MKMPAFIEETMFATCGMNCMVCYKHCSNAKPCPGCLANDGGKPEHCRVCGIKTCAAEKGYSYCHECSDFACKRIKNLEKSYTTQYGASLIQNSLFVKEQGIAAFMDGQKKLFTCPQCGGVISLHDAVCSECKAGTMKI